MHEMSLAQSISEIIERAAKSNSASKVLRIKLMIGQLSGVDIPSLMQSLTICSQNTIFEKAQFEIERTDGSAWCMDCSKTIPLERIGNACPSCGSYHLSINGGTEFKVSEIILETKE